MTAEKTKQYTSNMLKEHLSDSGVFLAELTANMAVDDPSLLKPLIDLAFNDTDPWSQRASRVVAICSCRIPSLIKPFAKSLVRNMRSFRSEGVRRNFLKIFTEVPINLPVKEQGILMSLCFDYLNGENSVSVKVYSMEVLYLLSRDYPEIKEELRVVIEDQIADSSAGFKSRGNKILTKLRKEINT
jgi:hypothetical protein